MKNWVRKIHLYLGFSSGIIVFIIAITGCIYCFQEELQDISQPYRFADDTKIERTPSFYLAKANAMLPGKKPHSVKYSKDNRSIIISYFDSNKYYYLVYLHPKSGNVLKVKNMDSDFFCFILNGHFYLWLPATIGQIVVSTATFIFTILLLTGIILWWPKKSNRKQRFVIKRKTKWRRRNYDLHTVGGFYLSIFGLLFAITGLIWGFTWVSSSLYFVSSKGKSMPAFSIPSVDSKKVGDKNAIDLIYKDIRIKYPNAVLEVHPPEQGSNTIEVSVNRDRSTYWKTDYLYFDAVSHKELEVNHSYGKLKNANGGDLMLRMNYDIHVGQIAGFWGKVILFFVSLGIACLPVTGFVLYYGRRNKKPIKNSFLK